MTFCTLVVSLPPLCGCVIRRVTGCLCLYVGLYAGVGGVPQNTLREQPAPYVPCEDG